MKNLEQETVTNRKFMTLAIIMLGLLGWILFVISGIQNINNLEQLRLLQKQAVEQEYAEFQIVVDKFDIKSEFKWKEND